MSEDKNRILEIPESQRAKISNGRMGDMLFSLGEMLFSFEGRINRAKYWLYSFLLSIIWLVGLFVDLLTTGEPGTFYWISVLVWFWPFLNVHVKRCHDRNKSGSYFLVAFIPFINILYFLEVGFFIGTVGSNRFGLDPLAQTNKLKRR
jgi:uncharacterized membrane protein YhaH (DUF805 family)